LSALATAALLATVVYAGNPGRAAAPTARSVEETKAPPKANPPLRTIGQPARRSPASFTPETSFGEAIDILRNCTSPPLKIVVLWKEIGENAGVYRDTPIGIDGIPGLRVGQYLDLLVLSLSAGAPSKLGYAVRHGVITVGTTDALPVPRNVTRVYDVSDLLAEPARYFFPPMGLGGVGYGGMYGGQMTGRGGFGTGYRTGTSYLPGGSFGYGGARGMAPFVNGLYGGAARTPFAYGR
jgi:hypothetical protein